MGKPQVCDRKSDFDLFCEHKCQCGEYNYHYWHTCSNTRNIILSRFLCNKDIDCPQVEDDGNCDATCTWEANFMLNYKLANLIPDVHRARISKGLSIPGPVNKKCYVLLATSILVILGTSAVIAVILLLPHFEDTFVNALYLPDVDFLRGFATNYQEKLEAYSSVILWQNKVRDFYPFLEQR